MELAYTVNGLCGGNGEVCICTGGCGILDRYIVFAGNGPYNTAFAYGNRKAEGPKSKLKKTTMLVFAVTLHNIPEGMAVGIVYAGYLAGNMQISAMGALALAIGIAIRISRRVQLYQCHLKPRE